MRDFEANLLRKICVDVETEPPLQPLNGENVNGLTGDESRPDVRARDVGGGVLQNLRKWFDDILEYGPMYGYNAEPTKSWLIVKEEQLQEAEIFSTV